MEYHLNFNFIWRYGDRLWWGLALSIELAVVSILLGCIIGFLLAAAYTGGGRLVRAAISAYVEFVRNVPLLLLVYLVFYGIPSAGGFAYDATTSFVATLSLYAGAYLVEVFRAGLDAIPKGAIDAGKAIGLTAWQRLIHVRMPIMLRIVLPSLSNAFISLFKDTSLASVIAVPELTYGANWIKTNTFRAVEVWIVTAPMYLVTGYAILVALRMLERALLTDRRK
jgi:polar amino acid transport system permease protein